MALHVPPKNDYIDVDRETWEDIYDWHKNKLTIKEN